MILLYDKGGLFMQASKKDYVGKILDMDRITELFPNRWVALSDCVYSQHVIDKCTLLDVFTDEEVEKGEMLDYIRNGVECMRTTIGLEAGYVNGKIVEDYHMVSND
jgi:hypothetical protein